MKKNAWFKATIICSILVLMAACSQSNTPNSSNNASQSPSAPTATPTPTEPPVVTAFLGRGTDYPENNPVIEEIRKRSGINLQVQTALFADEENKLNTLLVSGQTPDFFIVNKTKLKELVENDVIMPLDDLLASHGQEVLADKGEYLKGPAYIDGKTYGIPGAVGYGKALAVRKDWLDHLGLEVPTTLEEYENVLRAFVQDDPDNNGQDDTIGIGVGILYHEPWEHIFAAYGVPYERPVLVDGEVTPWMLAPGYLDAIKYWNKLFHEGLMEPEFATIPRLQLVEKLWNGKAGVWNYPAAGTSQGWLTRYVEDPKPEFVYTVIKGPDGHGGTVKVHREDPTNYMVVNKRAKNPEAVMQIINFLASEEGDTLTYYGIEGKHYKLVNGLAEMIPPYDDAVTLRNDGGFMYTNLSSRQDAMQFKQFNEVTQQGNRLSEEYTVDEVYIYDVPAVQVDRGSILKSMEEEFRAKAIMGAADKIDALYEQFKTNYLKEGGSKWIEQATEIYKKEAAR